VVSTDKGMVGKKIKMDNLLGTHSGDYEINNFNHVMLCGLVNVYSHFR